MKMVQRIYCGCICAGLMLLTTSCRQDVATALPLEGTWELVSETKIENGDTTFSPVSKDQRMIKIINKDHFAFLKHDVNSKRDSAAVFVAGGGTYSRIDNVYKEHLEFFIEREWENHDFEFTIEIRNDTLIQQGQEKLEGSNIDRYIIEKYRRVHN